MAPVIRANSLYILVDGPSWTEAEANSVTTGGHLVTINNSEENAFLVENFAYPDPAPETSATGGYARNSTYPLHWIGLTDRDIEGDWKWISGEPVTYTNWIDGLNPPNHTWYSSLGADYAAIDYYQATPTDTVDNGSWWEWSEGERSLGVTQDNTQGIAEIPLELSIDLSTSPKEGAGEFIVDIDLTAGTAAEYKYSLVKDAQVWYVVSGITQEDLESGYSLTGTGTINASGNIVLTGASSAGIKFALKDDGVAEIEDFKITFYTADPSTTTEVLDDAQLGALASSTVEDTGNRPVIRGNSLYTIVSGQNWLWTEAQQISRDLGGDLITINDQAEWDWFRSEYSPANGYAYADSYNYYPNGEVQLWVGLNDVTTEEEYVWASGQSSSVAFSDLVRTNGFGTPTADDYGIWQWEQGKLGFYTNDVPAEWADFAEQIRGVAEIPLTSSITFSTTPKEGGGVFATSINLSAGTQTSGNLAEGAQVWWKITGITADDLASGALSGTGTIQNGKLDIQHSLRVDPDSGESFEVSVFSDASMTSEYQIGTKSSVVIIDGNNSPTDITFTSSGINENSAAGTIIGTLAATDPDSGDTFTYELVAGNGTNDADNSLVEIVGNEVRVKSGAVIDFETNPLLNLNIQVTDNGTPGLTYTKAVTASVLDVVETPADTTPPTISSISTQGTTVILKFSEAVSATSVPTTRFAVATLDSRNRATNRTISTIALDQNDSTRVILTLTGTAPASTVNLRVSYTDPANNQTTAVIQDVAGNDLASFSNRFADTFITAATTTLASQYQNLTLTGNSAVSGTGNSLANTITGNSANNTIRGLGGADKLTGLGGVDTFTYALADSRLAAFDHITDFAIGTDRIDGPSAVSTANLSELGTVSALTQAGIAAVLTTSTFVSNGAATFSFGTGPSARTFLALNDGTAGYSSTSDGLIEITGFTGELTNLAVV